MAIAVIKFGGSNCEKDTVRALSYLGIESKIVWYKEEISEDTDGIIIPGGFSYGDYLRAGSMASITPIMDSIRCFAEDGIPVMGICNGAQISCESGLTSGLFTTNKSCRFICKNVYIRVENIDTIWTEKYEEREVIQIPIAHGEGRFEIRDEEMKIMEKDDRVLFRYCDESGRITDESNPNGSKNNIAGILGDKSNIAVMMPHPERATLPELHLTDGSKILQGFLR
mgnify:FL=1